VLGSWRFLPGRRALPWSRVGEPVSALGPLVTRWIEALRYQLIALPHGRGARSDFRGVLACGMGLVPFDLALGLDVLPTTGAPSPETRLPLKHTRSSMASTLWGDPSPAV